MPQYSGTLNSELSVGNQSPASPSQGKTRSSSCQLNILAVALRLSHHACSRKKGGSSSDRKLIWFYFSIDQVRLVWHCKQDLLQRERARRTWGARKVKLLLYYLSSKQWWFCIISCENHDVLMINDHTVPYCIWQFKLPYQCRIQKHAISVFLIINQSFKFLTTRN